jgi:uncharacterized membrane protein
MALVLSLSVLAIVTTAVTEPANVDDLDYHYPKLFWMLQTGSFATSGLELVDGYPQNGEILGTFIALATNSVQLVDGFQLLILPLWLASVWSLGAAFKIPYRTNAAVTLVSVCIPSFWSLLITFHVDLVAVALLLSSLALLYARDLFARHTQLALLGASLGLLLGTKYVALPWVGVVLVATLLSSQRPHSVRQFLALVVPLSILGFEPYVANAIRTGNPLYPYSLPVLGWITPAHPRTLGALWEEEMSKGSSVLGRIVMSWFSPDAIAQSNHEHWFGGFGLVWPLLFACVLGVTVSALRNREYRFVGLVSVTIALFLVTPALYTTRFVLFLPAIGAIACGTVLTLLDTRKLEVARISLVSLLALASLHCARQNISLLSHELRGRRGETLAASCQNVARPAEFRELLNTHGRQSLSDSTEIVVVRGSNPEDRLVSYGCFWALAPHALIHFDEAHHASELLVKTHHNKRKRIVVFARDSAERASLKALLTPIVENGPVVFAEAVTAH